MPTATVDLSAISHNLSRLSEYLEPNTRLLVAVKANAYGHGAVQVAKHLEKSGVTWFGVATRDEALELRGAGITANILIFIPVYDGLEALIETDVALTIVDEQSLQAAARAAQEVGKARVHLKVDTGMGRLGPPPNEVLALAKAADSAKEVQLEAVWTHFACADDAERDYTEGQLNQYGEVLRKLEQAGIPVPIKHAANSSGLIAYPESHFDMVRPGIAVYGLHSSPVIAGLEPRLIPAMTLSAPITFVKEVKAGTCVSYGATWSAPYDTKVATVRLGYGDGLFRTLSGQLCVTVQGERRPLAGRICMDQFMVDVGDLDVQPGERVTLFGSEGQSAEDLAGLNGTISYELLTRLGPRIRRVYLSS